MSSKPDYGIDSPAIVLGQLTVGLLAIALAFLKPRVFGFQLRWICVGVGVYSLYGALSMVQYSKSGKLKLREKLLDMIPWQGDEIVLDVGCGRGLLLAGAARRLKTGRAIGVDVFDPHAITGNRPEAVMRNAALEGVKDRVEVKEGDARDLPFSPDTFDVVLSNFVLHEMDTAAERERMLCEMTRVLKPGGRLALIDFIFTKECVGTLQKVGLPDATRSRIGGLQFWVGVLLMLGVFQLYAVRATKGSEREGKVQVQGP
jgi:arsenite methyltransferase